MLLRALLWDGPAAREQWSRWSERVRDPRAYFEREYVGRKGLLAFLGQRLSENDTDLPAALATYFRVARVREELRSRIFIEVLGDVTTRLGGAGIMPVLLNGAAYAFTVYSEPLTRHNHGIDLLVPEDEVEQVGRLVVEEGFQTFGRVSGGLIREYRHHTGLALTVRSALLCIPHAERDATTFRSRSVAIGVDGRRISVLRPEDRLCHTLIEGASASTRRNLRWACDAFLLMKTGTVDFDGLAASALELRAPFQVAVLLDYFRSSLQLPIPRSTVDALKREPPPRDRRTEAGLLSAALRTSQSARAFVRRAKPHRALYKKALRFAVLPTGEHMRYQVRASRSRVVAGLHLARTRRYLRRFLRRRGAQAGRPASSASDVDGGSNRESNA